MANKRINGFRATTMDKSHKLHVQQKKTNVRAHTVGFHLCKVPEQQSLW